MTRPAQDIVNDLLEWRNPYNQMDLATHLRHELERLGERIERKPSFSGRYEQSSGALPVTMLSKLEDCAELLERWKSEEVCSIFSDRDKSVVSDMLEFITLPFYCFGTVCVDALGQNGAMAAALAGISPSNVAQLNQRAEQMAAQHRHLCELLVELCNMLDYTLPPSVRTLSIAGIGMDSNSLRTDRDL
jgi:hypothetical protein